MFLLLVACGAIYLLLGDLQEALILLGFVLLVAGITLYQERKTERALEALRDLTSPRALVIRDGARRRIAGREVVRGDSWCWPRAIACRPTRRCSPCVNLSVDESLLTGESVPVRKATVGRAPPPSGRPGGDDLPFVFAGTLITHGHGVARGRSDRRAHGDGRDRQGPADRRHRSAAPLQRETGRLVRWLAVIGVALCVVVVVAYGLTRGDWLGGSLAGPDPGDGDPAQRVPGRADRLPRARRVAHLAAARPDAPGSRRSRRSAPPPCCASTRPAR